MGVISDDEERETLILTLYTHLLRRQPTAGELRKWTISSKLLAPLEIISAFVDSPEYKRNHSVRCFFPDGHFHSPVVNPEEVKDYVRERENPGPDGFPGIPIDLAAMEAFWRDNESSFQSAPFRDEQSDEHRYNYMGGPFPHGDGISLFTIMGRYKPKRVVEIGSGYSTACMLDSAQIHSLPDLKITCIDPYPRRLKSILRPGDEKTVEIVEAGVQSVSVERIVGELEENDILFIDSTHVMKTGSDVHYEIFELIPAIKPGVLVHVHDCHYPFEYPDGWVFDKNYSWNETYALRAFLMFNKQFEIFFWGSMLKRLRPELVAKTGGMFGVNAGGSIWLKRTS